MNKFARFVPATRARLAKVGAAAGALALASAAHAQSSTDPISGLFDSIDISGVAAKIGVLALVIVGIALAVKGPSVVKRIVQKI